MQTQHPTKRVSKVWAPKSPLPSPAALLGGGEKSGSGEKRGGEERGYFMVIDWTSRAA